MRAEAGLLERDGVVASAAELVDRVSSGGSGALFLAGEAGLGKTSVIDRACQRAAEAGLAVGVGRGHPMESGLPFGVLVQALDGVGGSGLLSGDAVDSRSAAEWPVRYHRMLHWLRQRAGGRMFLAIDDLHWADEHDGSGIGNSLVAAGRLYATCNHIAHAEAPSGSRATYGGHSGGGPLD